ncbi:CDP-glycerol glycerophosphotransferase family protein [Halorhodospira halochloris]|uniref:CDP-glycerol glycerophosphotransferase family protein n=1 Tax=Halorhodospira halochloris TaxID=1052 RepID=UPI001EE7E292|nr:CDP-glycerol glycerophosphotransferase family protein [Halorhodospira halochloris]MCG5531307.1 CDP-glycerol glycerophosphotransferase family protein [Halorhodospira halochloris]
MHRFHLQEERCLVGTYNSQAIFWQNDSFTSKITLSGLRRVGKIRNQLIIKLYHGMITKGHEYTGLLTTKNLNNHPKTVMAPYAHFSIAQGAVESYMRYWKEMNDKCAVPEIRALGYPRFYRAMNLRNGDEKVVLPDSIESVLKKHAGDFHKLYAPTRKPRINEIYGFDWERFDEYLEANKMTLYLKLHPLVRCHNLNLPFKQLSRMVILPADGIVDSLELLSRMNCLITDISSVMMEAIALGKPVVHVNVEHEKELLFEHHVALPGANARDFNELSSRLSQCMRGEMDEMIGTIRETWNLNRQDSIEESWSEIL